MGLALTMWIWMLPGKKGSWSRIRRERILFQSPNSRLGLMLALARQIPEAVEAVHQGKWPRYSGVSLEGKTVGILGLGAIGKQLARRLSGFDCKILAYDPFADADFAKDNHIELASMDEVIAAGGFPQPPPSPSARNPRHCE